ncbi:recombinase family protein [Streptomyces buecherae]|uniref:Recombinase family protein n=1 Tax=Streptomyces buecherae TaxID=2763006 RepID=A0A7H8N625_9ACTN|nr:recombinase family protein [Streptomyces buecherae]
MATTGNVPSSGDDYRPEPSLATFVAGGSPPPVPPDPSRGVGQWTQSSVRDVLTNPKHTGRMVWNRRAR